MMYRLVVGVLGALTAALLVPVATHADPSVPPGQPVKCVSNTQKGKQVLVPCDLLNAGASFPFGYRCPPPLEQYTQDVQDWCGVGPGLGATPPGAAPPPPISPTSPTKPASPTPTSASSPTPATPTSPTTPTTTSSPSPAPPR